MKEMVKKGTGSGMTWMGGTLNGWIGDRMRDGIIGALKVPGDNDNGRRAVEFCAERGLCLVNT